MSKQVSEAPSVAAAFATYEREIASHMAHHIPPPPIVADRYDAVCALLDALSMPDGRCVAKAWDRVCLLHGRSGDVMKRAAFETYLDDLAGVEK